ncbi:hypothetical protein RI129_002271 [Pyrocoelia pectoralis]|uniref:Solute carrier family 46 member 3 n=1 Tax=Pyrocoelia pectoralis TaxID=417401 RepID=A0AAN7VIR9_9COLE
MKIRLILNAITIEPLLICYVAARAMCDPTLKNLELDKACFVKANYNGTVCNTITNGTFEQRNFTKENNAIQLHITNMHSWQVSASSMITMFVVLLLGTLSDHYKVRKPFLIFSVAGQLVEFSGCILCVTYMDECPLEVLGIAQEIVLSLFGGEKLFLAAIFAYLTDITLEENRTLRIAIIQGIYNICFGIGHFFTGTLLSQLGYTIILIIGSVLTTLGLAYGIFFVKESSIISKENVDKDAITRLTGKEFLETLKLFSKYPKSQNFKIIEILIVLAIASTISNGELSVMFLFTETAYSWTIREYTYFFTITTTINTLGLTCAVPLFTEVLKLHDLLIIAAAFINRIVVNIVYVTVRTPMGLYIGCSIAILRILTLVGIRSQLTKYVHQFDVCKVLALYTVVDSCSEAFASALYNKGIYGPTQSTFPHAFFLAGIGLSTIGILIVLVMYYMVKKSQTKDEKGTSAFEAVQCYRFGKMEPNKETQEKLEGKTIQCLKKMNLKERFLLIKKVITIEPLVCLLVLARIMSGPALTNLQFEKACKVNAKYNDTVCDAIVSGTYRQKNFTEENNVVQSYITGMRSWEVPLSSVLPVIIILFVGAYSDRHKIRKPFMLMPLIGDMVGLIGSAINVWYMYEWPLEILIISDKVIPSIFGSEKMITTIGYAYIADISTKEMRLIRLTTIPIALTVLTPIFQAVSGILFRKVGYFAIFAISLCMFIMAFTYGLCVVKESVKMKRKKKELIKDVCNIQHVTDTFKLLVQKKENMDRTNFLTLLLIFFLHGMVFSGEQSTFFLFVQQAYQWTVVEYSYFTTANTVLKFIALSVAVPIFVKVFKLRDLTIMLIAYLDSILASIIFVTVQLPVGLYIGRACSILIATGLPASRSLVTKVVSSEDVAKAISLSTIIQAIAAAVAAQIYHRGIYEHTRKSFPQAFLLLGVGIHILEIFIILGMYWRERHNQQHVGNTTTDVVLEAQITEEIHL